MRKPAIALRRLVSYDRKTVIFNYFDRKEKSRKLKQ
ncbi:MAG TPA: hypothetical protein GX527_05350 [Clostridiaceae bacterium]|nr:hypothetical protein [Clostridiaceae bacterium]